MPKDRLNVSQMMTIGAKVVPILDVPRGCIKKRHMRMPQDAPIMVDDVILGTTTSNLGYISHYTMFVGYRTGLSICQIRRVMFASRIYVTVFERQKQQTLTLG